MALRSISRAFPGQRPDDLRGIEACKTISAGATIEFGSDRVGHVLGSVIDGTPRKDGPASEWVVWVNANSFQTRLGTETSFGFKPDEREGNLLKAGDHVLVKLSLLQEKHQSVMVKHC